MHYTFSPRRLFTPMSRHERAVAFRHEPVHFHHEAITELIREKEPDAEIPFQETVSKKAEPEITEDIPVVKTKQKLDRRQMKRIARDEELDKLARQPYSSLFQLIVDPFGSVRRSSENCFIEYTLIASGLINLLKWLLLGMIPACIIADKINVHAFSYALVSFSLTAKIAAEIGIVGYICETLILWMIAQSSRLSSFSMSFAETVDSHTHGSVILIVNALAGIALSGSMPHLGLAVAIASLAEMVCLDIYMIYLYQEKKKSRLIIEYLALWGAYVVIMITCAQFLEQQLSDILMLIG